MEVRFSTDPLSFKEMAPGELRSAFLIDSLFVTDRVPMVYSDIDRSITGSAVPVREPLELLSSKKEMASEYFAERREIGVINTGGEGTVSVDAKPYRLLRDDALYIGRGARRIVFESAAPSTPAQFYFVSYPAHASYPTRLVPFGTAEKVRLGNQRDANCRTINKLIHPGSFPTCQLVMGLTRLDEGSVWNTMPPHTHQRRSEIYMYFDLPPSALVFHFIGEPGETRHIVVRNGQAVLSPSWSVHTGVATQAYTFIWAMGGENQVFDDMDAVDTTRIG